MLIRHGILGGVILTGEDAKAFSAQVAKGPSQETLRIGQEALQRGKILLAEMHKSGLVKLRLNGENDAH